MIPRTWGCDLTKRERQDLVDLLSQSPGLWAFGITAGIMGLDGAVDACRDPSLITMNVVDKLRAVHYQPESCLPAQEDIFAILMGIRLRARMRPQQKKRPPLQRVARGLGLDIKTAQSALRTLNVHTSAVYERFGL